MQREEASKLLKQNIKNRNLIKHSLAVESAMKELANHFSQNEEQWGVCGLLHDIDYEKTKQDLYLHAKVGAEMLKELGFNGEICHSVLTHNEAHGLLPKTLMAKALFCLDPLTGLIVAATLVLPSKKLDDLTVQNVLNRFKERSFAKGANREVIAKCNEYLNLTLEEFIRIVLKAMQKVSKELGL
jgi:putative nucleotidyltransferase with HDIG domain